LKTQLKINQLLTVKEITTGNTTFSAAVAKTTPSYIYCRHLHQHQHHQLHLLPTPTPTPAASAAGTTTAFERSHGKPLEHFKNENIDQYDEDGDHHNRKSGNNLRQSYENTNEDVIRQKWKEIMNERKKVLS
jgi:hypothetical protein